jgi:hypothetical protein
MIRNSGLHEDSKIYIRDDLEIRLPEYEVE